MVVRRCPRCHSAGDDQYGFCIKCGYEFPKIEENAHICPLCNYENPEEAEFCVKCGSPLFLKQQFESSQTSFGPIIVQKTVSKEPVEYDGPRTSRLIIVLGYIFSILGGLIGLIIALYLVTRKDPVAKKHGCIQLAIFVFYLVLILALLLTGVISQDTLMQYTQMNWSNLTKFP